MAGLLRLSMLRNGVRFQRKKFEELVGGNIVLARPIIKKQRLFKLVQYNQNYTCDYGESQPVNCSYFNAVMLDDNRDETEIVRKINAGESYVNQKTSFDEKTGRNTLVSQNTYLKSNFSNQLTNTPISDLREGDIIYDPIYTNEDGYLELLRFKTVKYDVVVGQDEPETDAFWLCLKLNSDIEPFQGQDKTAIAAPSIQRDLIALSNEQIRTGDFNLKLHDIKSTFDMYYHVLY